MKKLIKSDDLRYFIFDTGNGHDKDVDFIQYTWSRSRFNKVREGDYFIYRRPSKVSENKKFYFFGIGRVGKITDYENHVICKINDPIRFNNIVYQEDISDYEWFWKKKKGKHFGQFFNNYGMNQIPFEDLDHFYRQGVGEVDSKNFNKTNLELVESHIQLLDVNKGKLGKKQSSNSRGSLGKIFSDNVRTIYDNRCCLTGISTRSILESSHISPWSTDEKNRGNEKNGLLLSLVLHKCFDNGFISLDNNYKVILSEKINDPNLLNYLNNFRGKKIRLPVRKEYNPDKSLIKKHREKWGFTSKN